MSHRHRTAGKPRREGKRNLQKQSQKRKAESASRDEQDHLPHPLFGAIPMIPIVVQLPDGTVHHGRDFDPDYAPPMPPRAVRGDVRKQVFCRMCHVPKYFYVDQARRCVECGLDFSFSASEQKHWFEELKFHFDSIPIRCVGCRRRRRSDKALGLELAAAKKRLRDSPASPAALVAVAEALVRYHDRSGQGSLAEALAASRKARRLLENHTPGELSETYFWEARCQALLGRPARARPLFEAFLEGGGGGKRRAQLARVAKAWLERS